MPSAVSWLDHPSICISSVEATYLATDTLMCSYVCIMLIVHSHGSGQACKVSCVISKGDQKYLSSQTEISEKMEVSPAGERLHQR